MVLVVGGWWLVVGGAVAVAVLEVGVTVDIDIDITHMQRNNKRH